MENNHSHLLPTVTDVPSDNSLVHETPNEYKFDTSVSDGNRTPGFTPDMPIAYNLNGDEKKNGKRRLSSRPNPHRKYSRKWWSYAYDTAVEVGKWPRIIYVLFGCILIGVWIAIMLTFAFDEVKFERNNLAGSATRTIGSRVGQDVLIKGTLRQFDPIARTLTVSWSLLMVDDDNVTLVDVGTSPKTTLQWNIYRDVKAVPEERNSTVLGKVPEFEYRVDNVTEVPIAVLGQHQWDSVTTQIDFSQAIEDSAWTQPLFAYPFDKWTGQIVFAATDRNLSTIAGLNNSYIREISDALLSDSTLNWRITANANDTCILPEAEAGCELHIDFSGTRPNLVVFAAVVAVIVNWTTTIGIFLITCEAVVMQRTYILKETDILGVCLTALFALPSVRSILPGAPDFGAIIDLIGIIPNVITISLCTTAIAISKLRMHRAKADKED